MSRPRAVPVHIPQDYDSLKAAYLALFAETDELFHRRGPSVSTCMDCPTCGELTRPRYLRDNGDGKSGCLECLSKQAVANAGLAIQAKLNEDAVKLIANKFIEQRRENADLAKRAGTAEAETQRARLKYGSLVVETTRRRKLLDLWLSWATGEVPYLPRSRIELLTHEELRRDG